MPFVFWSIVLIVVAAGVLWGRRRRRARIRAVAEHGLVPGAHATGRDGGAPDGYEVHRATITGQGPLGPTM